MAESKVPAKGKGKGPGPPPRSQRKSAESRDVPSMGEPMTSSRSALPDNRKRLHLNQCYKAPSNNTVFDNSNNEAVDHRILDILLQQENQPPQQEHAVASVPARASSGQIITNPNRAMHIEIAWKKVAASPREVCLALETMDMSGEKLSEKDVECLMGKMPTKDEASKLRASASSSAKLRPIEELILPLAFVADAEKRLHLLHVGLSHAQHFRELLARFDKMKLAAKEVRYAEKFHSVLRHCLSIANKINQEEATSFSVSRFEALARYRLNGLSPLDIVCYERWNLQFVASLRKDLAHVPEAARASTEDYIKDLQVLKDYAAAAEVHWKIEERRDAQERVLALKHELVREIIQAEEAHKKAKLDVEEAQVFLGERSTELEKPESFFAHVVQLLRTLERTAEEVASNPPQVQALLAASKEPRSSVDGSLQDLSLMEHSRFEGLPVSVRAHGHTVLDAVVALNNGEHLSAEPS